MLPAERHKLLASQAIAGLKVYFTFKIFWAALNFVNHNIVLFINPNNKANKAHFNLLQIRTYFVDLF